jgi:hypothetical protein
VDVREGVHHLLLDFLVQVKELKLLLDHRLLRRRGCIAASCAIVTKFEVRNGGASPNLYVGNLVEKEVGLVDGLCAGHRVENLVKSII